MFAWDVSQAFAWDVSQASMMGFGTAKACCAGLAQQGVLAQQVPYCAGGDLSSATRDSLTELVSLDCYGVVEALSGTKGTVSVPRKSSIVVSLSDYICSALSLLTVVMRCCSCESQ